MIGKHLLKDFMNRYRHAWVLLYGAIYMPWFMYLERRTIPEQDYWIISSPLDQYIPFCEIFIIPYLLWFAFVAIGVAYFFFTSRREFYQVMGFLIIGMTIFLLISTFIPNGLNLRPEEFPRENFFTNLLKSSIYDNDTSTNVFPSIHAFNSLGISIAVFHSDALKKKTFIQIATHVTTILILISTVCLKQHSILDVFAALLLSAIIHPFIYGIYKKKIKTTG